MKNFFHFAFLILSALVLIGALPFIVIRPDIAFFLMLFVAPPLAVIAAIFQD